MDAALLLLLSAFSFQLSALAQTYTINHRFSGGSGGGGPRSAPILSADTLYGTTGQAGAGNAGIVYRVNPDDTGFTNLHDFTTTNGGYSPYGVLVLSGGTLYGTAFSGGTGTKGTVFKVNSDGSGFAPLYQFSGYDGSGPYGGLVLSGSRLYGTTWVGGYLNGFMGDGTVFSVQTDGNGFTSLHTFDYYSEGGGVFGALALSEGALYGTTQNGAAGGGGTVFKINTDGTGFATLHVFSPGTGSALTNSDGRNSYGTLVVSGNTLYGTTRLGGTAGQGVVFKISTSGADFVNLHSFPALSGVSGTNSQGAQPQGGLALRGSTLYGTSTFGGTAGLGTVFAVRTDGTGFTNLHNFTSTGADGQSPWYAGLTLAGDTVYGATPSGGIPASQGTLFSLALPPLPQPPQLNITLSGTNAVLTWQTNAAAVSLQVAPAVTGLFTNIPTATSPYTNPIVEPEKYFRLILN